MPKGPPEWSVNDVGHDLEHDDFVGNYFRVVILPKSFRRCSRKGRYTAKLSGKRMLQVDEAAFLDPRTVTPAQRQEDFDDMHHETKMDNPAPAKTVIRRVNLAVPSPASQRSAGSPGPH